MTWQRRRETKGEEEKLAHWSVWLFGNDYRLLRRRRKIWANFCQLCVLRNLFQFIYQFDEGIKSFRQHLSPSLLMRMCNMRSNVAIANSECHHELIQFQSRFEFLWIEMIFCFKQDSNSGGDEIKIKTLLLVLICTPVDSTAHQVFPSLVNF